MECCDCFQYRLEVREWVQDCPESLRREVEWQSRETLFGSRDYETPVHVPDKDPSRGR